MQTKIACGIFFISCLLFLGNIYADVSVTGEGKNLSISNGKTKISAIVKGSGVIGFRVLSLEGGKEIEVAPVELSSSGKWTALTVESGKDKDRVWFVLKDIDTKGTGGTPQLGKDSFVKVQLDGDNPFPLIEFRLNVQSFDGGRWESSWQTKCPMYFLRCTLDEAQCFYQGGELYPSPTIDPYPISMGEMKGQWANNWSYAPAVGAHPVPAMGLWAPQLKKFVAYEFQHSRSTEKSDKYIGNAFCAGQPDHPSASSGRVPSQFFTLLYPHARSWIHLTYLDGPVLIASHFRIIYNLNIPAWEDPNMFVMNYIHKTYYDLLPSCPKMNDLSWLNRQYDLYGALLISDIKKRTYSKTVGRIRLFSRYEECEKQFFKPGAVQLNGHIVRDRIAYAYLVGDKQAIDTLKSEIEYLIPKAIKKSYEDGDAYVWEHPLEGSFQDRLGGEKATSTQNMFNWAIAEAMLQVYMNEKIEKYLPYIDGMLTWSRHYLYDIAGMADLPWAVFSMAAGNAGEFLLDYYYFFRNDPLRKKKAEEAFRLARVIFYRNTYSYTDDPDETDWLDPTYLLQAVNSKYWIGIVTWGEMGRIPMMAIPIYVDTGDPILKYIIRGCLERFPFGVCKKDGSFYENIDVFGMWHKGQGSGGWGSSNFRRYTEPVADAIMRVVVGTKAAIAFDKGTFAVDVADYCYEPEGNFRFRISVNKTLQNAPSEAFSIIITYPYRSLKGKQVSVNDVRLGEDRYLISTCGEDVYVSGVKDGDVVTVGELKNREPFKVIEPKFREAVKDKFLTYDVFKMVNLYPFANTVLNNTWQGEWGGLYTDRLFFRGIPYFIVEPELNQGKAAAGGDKEVIIPVDEQVKSIFVFASTGGKIGKIGEYEILYSSGKSEKVELKGGIEVRKGIKYLKKEWEIDMFGFFPPEFREVKSIRVPQGLTVFAITLQAGESERSRTTLKALNDYIEEKNAVQSHTNYQVPGEKSRIEADWWNKDWHYRFLVEIGSREYDRLDHIVRIKEDFGLVLKQIGVDDALDANSVRVVEYNPSGKIARQVLAQFDPGPAQDKGEILFIIPGRFKAGDKKLFYSYFDTMKNQKKLEKPSIEYSFDNYSVTIDAKEKGVRMEFSIIPKRGPRVDGIYFGGEDNLLGPSGYVGGYGTLTAVTDGQCWYNFGSLQEENAVPRVIHNGPLSLTLAISGIEAFGTPPQKPSRKGDATWFFQFFKGEKRFDEWVNTSIRSNPGWTRKLQVRYGLREWGSAGNFEKGDFKYASTGNMVALPLQDFPDRVQVVTLFTTDGNVLQIELEKMEGTGEYYSDRWRILPADLTVEDYIGNVKMISINQFSAEVLEGNKPVKPDLKTVEVQPYNSRELFTKQK